MTATAPFLAVHVVGPGYGECIILELPGSWPAVIDCGSVRVAQWAIRFLRGDLKAEELSFVAISHPHEDHFDGLSSIVREFGNKTNRIWFFPGFVEGDMVARVLQLASLGVAAQDLDGDFFCATVAHEWSDLMGQILDLKLGCVEMHEFAKPVSLNPHLNIQCLLPVQRLATQFRLDLARCAPGWSWISAYPNGGHVSVGKPPKGNDASSALLMSWGETNVLLCSDCEKPSWLAFQSEGNPDNLPSDNACEE